MNSNHGCKRPTPSCHYLYDSMILTHVGGGGGRLGTIWTSHLLRYCLFVGSVSQNSLEMSMALRAGWVGVLSTQCFEGSLVGALLHTIQRRGRTGTKASRPSISLQGDGKSEGCGDFLSFGLLLPCFIPTEAKTGIGGGGDPWNSMKHNPFCVGGGWCCGGMLLLCLKEVRLPGCAIYYQIYNAHFSSRNTLVFQGGRGRGQGGRPCVDSWMDGMFRGPAAGKAGLRGQGALGCSARSGAAGGPRGWSGTNRPE